VSGGAVTTLSTGTISLTEGVPYFFRMARTNISLQSSISIYINNYTTGSYESGFVQCSNSSTIVDGDTAQPVGIRTESDEPAVYQGICGLQNSTPYVLGTVVGQDSNKRGTLWGGYNTNQTTFTELQMTAGGARVDNDSNIQIWRLDQTPYAEVTVAGASVTEMTTGTFTGFTDGKSYMFVVGLTCDTAAAYYRLRINSDDTGTNYHRGKVTSNGVSDTTDSVTIGTLTAGSTMSMIWGYCGLLDGIPYASAMTLEHSGGQRATQQVVWNTNETTFTELSLLSGTASNIKAGSYIKIWGIG